jgi:hypothetical protein
MKMRYKVHYNAGSITAEGLEEWLNGQAALGYRLAGTVTADKNEAKGEPFALLLIMEQDASSREW